MSADLNLKLNKYSNKNSTCSDYFSTLETDHAA